MDLSKLKVGNEFSGLAELGREINDPPPRGRKYKEHIENWNRFFEWESLGEGTHKIRITKIHPTPLPPDGEEPKAKRLQGKFNRHIAVILGYLLVKKETRLQVTENLLLYKLGIVNKQYRKAQRLWGTKGLEGIHEIIPKNIYSRQLSGVEYKAFFDISAQALDSIAKAVKRLDGKLFHVSKEYVTKDTKYSDKHTIADEYRKEKINRIVDFLCKDIFGMTDEGHLIQRLRFFPNHKDPRRLGEYYSLKKRLIALKLGCEYSYQCLVITTMDDSGQEEVSSAEHIAARESLKATFLDGFPKKVNRYWEKHQGKIKGLEDIEDFVAAQQALMDYFTDQSDYVDDEPMLTLEELEEWNDEDVFSLNVSYGIDDLTPEDQAELEELHKREDNNFTATLAEVFRQGWVTVVDDDTLF